MTADFERLLKIDVKDHIEKKGKFSYLSWAWAVQEFRKAVPNATWEVIRFEGKPFLSTECGYFVEVAVTIGEITLSQIHPILDNYNKPIEKPNAFEVNTSIQRALVKAIALHGLGLHIYAGEDLPDDNGDHAPKYKALEEHKKHKKEMDEFFSGKVTTCKVTTGIAKITEKEGKYPWKILGEGNIVYSTYSDSLEAIAKSAMDAGCKVEIITKGDKYNTIKDIHILEG